MLQRAPQTLDLDFWTGLLKEFEKMYESCVLLNTINTNHTN